MELLKLCVWEHTCGFWLRHALQPGIIDFASQNRSTPTMTRKGILLLLGVLPAGVMRSMNTPIQIIRGPVARMEAKEKALAMQAPKVEIAVDR